MCSPYTDLELVSQGDRYENIRKAIALLPQHGVQVRLALECCVLLLRNRVETDLIAQRLGIWRHISGLPAWPAVGYFMLRSVHSVHWAQVARYARLYESTPAYITEQPNFLNTAIAANTKLPPDQLLSALKSVEACLPLQHVSPWPINNAKEPTSSKDAVHSVCRMIHADCMMLLPAGSTRQGRKWPTQRPPTHRSRCRLLRRYSSGHK